MHRDVFIFKKEHEERGQVILDKFLDETVDSDYTGVIGICGISGSGKSEVAWWVARKLYKLGISSHVINLDRYYKIPAKDRNAWRKENNYIGRKEMDWNRINDEVYKFGDNAIKVLIVEGLYAGYVNGITFFLEDTIEGTDQWRKLRGKEDEEDEFRQYVVGEEYADILSGMRLYDYKI